MKTISLDLKKINGLNKSFTSRVMDSGDTINVLLNNDGKPVTMSDVKTVTLKVVKPDNSPLNVTGTITSAGATFFIPSSFNNIKGYFKDAFVQLGMKDGKVQSTQPFMYYSYGDVDISTENAQDYISRV